VDRQERHRDTRGGEAGSCGPGRERGNDGAECGWVGHGLSHRCHRTARMPSALRLWLLNHARDSPSPYSSSYAGGDGRVGCRNNSNHHINNGCSAVFRPCQGPDRGTPGKSEHVCAQRCLYAARQGAGWALVGLRKRRSRVRPIAVATLDGVLDLGIRSVLSMGAQLTILQRPWLVQRARCSGCAWLGFFRVSRSHIRLCPVARSHWRKMSKPTKIWRVCLNRVRIWRICISVGHSSGQNYGVVSQLGALFSEPPVSRPLARRAPEHL
jgi:hypothetical protein